MSAEAPDPGAALARFRDAVVFGGGSHTRPRPTRSGGAPGTPTFFIGERRHIGPYDAETLARALQSEREPASI